MANVYLVVDNPDYGDTQLPVKVFMERANAQKFIDEDMANDNYPMIREFSCGANALAPKTIPYPSYDPKPKWDESMGKTQYDLAHSNWQRDKPLKLKAYKEAVLNEDERAKNDIEALARKITGGRYGADEIRGLPTSDYEKLSIVEVELG